MANAIPIKVWKILGSNGAQPVTKRVTEKASETFKVGTPLAITSGLACVSPTLSSALKITGFSQEPASNLTTAGVRKTLTFGSVENQSSAVLIPGGAPLNDGTVGIWVARDEVIFIGVVLATKTPAITDLGVIYGLTLDSNGYWYVDKDVTAAASGAICEIVELPVIPGDALAPLVPVLGGKVCFKITKAGQFYSV